MSYNLGVLSALVTLKTEEFDNSLTKLEQKSESSFQKIAKAAENYLTVNAIVNFGQKAIKTFSDLQEATNKFNVVFAGFSSDAQKEVDELIAKFGQSELSAKQMLSGTGDILTGFGFDKKNALEMSALAAKLGADLASFSNYAGGAKGATDALTKAMLGETEMAKMLGIVIRQDSDQYKLLAEQAMTTGVDIDGSGRMVKVSTEQQAKAVAALAMAYQQSPNAIGDFLRSQDSIANQTQILKNNLDTLYATIGSDGASAFADFLQAANSLLKGYSEMDKGTRSLINNAVILTGALVVLNKMGVLSFVKNLITAGAKLAVNATLIHTNTIATTSASIATKVNTLSTGTNTVARGVNTTAAVVNTAANTANAASHMAVATAANVAMAAISGLAIGLAAGYMMTQHMNAKLQEQVDVEAKRSEEIRAQGQALKEQHAVDQDRLSRLEELSKYEKLNNLEKKEADEIAKELQKTYGDLGIKIDSVTGKLSMNADAWETVGKKQREQALKQTLKEVDANKRLAIASAQAAWSDITGGHGNKFTGIGRDVANIINQGNVDQTIKTFKRYEQTLRDGGNAKGALAIQNLITLLEQRKKLVQQYKDIEAAGDDAAKKEAERRKKTLAQQAKAQRDAEDSVAKTEWDIEFNESDTAKKAKMVGKKIDKIFEEYKSKGKYSSLDEFLSAKDSDRNEKELKDLEKIIKLIAQEKKLLKQVDDEKARALEEQERKRKEQERELETAKKRQKSIEKMHGDFLADEATRRIELQLKNLKNAGDESGYKDLLKQELDKAKDAAEKTREAYIDAYSKANEEAKKGNGISRETEERLKELLQAAETAQQQEQRYRDRLNTDNSADNQQQEVRKAVGSWSLAEFSRQAENSVESKIERNTRITARILQNNKDRWVY
jgi:hypothetical protein